MMFISSQHVLMGTIEIFFCSFFFLTNFTNINTFHLLNVVGPCVKTQLFSFLADNFSTLIYIMYRFFQFYRAEECLQALLT